MGQGRKPSILSRMLGLWQRVVMCALLEHHHFGDASAIGLSRGVVCYACGTRLHSCGCQHRPAPIRPEDRRVPFWVWLVVLVIPLFVGMLYAAWQAWVLAP